MTNGSTPAGWYQDPTGQGDARYWNGTAWTQSVNRAGTTLNIAIDPSIAQQPPTPGTQVQAPQPAAQAPQTVVQQSSSGSPLGTIIGVVVVVLLIVVVLAFIGDSNSSDDSPTPGTQAPATEAPATEAPAPEAPADTGG